MRLVREVAQVYEDAEARTIALVAKYAKRGLDEPDYLKRRLAEIHELQRELRSIVAGLNGDGPAAARKAILEARAIGVADAKRQVGRVLIAERLSGGIAEPNVAAIATLASKAADALTRTDLRILRGAEDAYRTVVARAAGEAMTGTLTRRAAAQAALNAFADRGITGMVDSAGRSWSLASYAEMSLRSTIGQACVQSALDTFSANGYDLVLVSESPGDCEKCSPWDGQVVSRGGESSDYPSLQEAIDDGLLHPNCTHQLGLYVEGLTQPGGPQDMGPSYDDLQQQRYLERGVRKWKTRQSVAIDDVAAKQAKAKVAEWQGRLREHVARTGAQRLPYREQIGRAI